MLSLVFSLKMKYFITFVLFSVFFFIFIRWQFLFQPIDKKIYHNVFKVSAFLEAFSFPCCESSPEVTVFLYFTLFTQNNYKSSELKVSNAMRERLNKLMNHLQNRCSTTKRELAERRVEAMWEEARSKETAPKSDIGGLGWWAPLQHLSAHLDTLQLYIYTFFISLYSLSLNWRWRLSEWTLWPFSVPLFQPNEKLINIPLMLYGKGRNLVIS